MASVTLTDALRWEVWREVEWHPIPSWDEDLSRKAAIQDG